MGGTAGARDGRAAAVPVGGRRAADEAARRMGPVTRAG